MKRILILFLVAVLAVYTAGCGKTDDKTIVAETVNKAVESTAKSTEKMEYTGEELSEKSLKEIVDIMGGSFEHAKSKGINNYTDGGYCIYNEKELPGFVFYLRMETPVSDEEYESMSNDEIKEMINDGLYTKDFIGINGSAKLNEKISADMHYNEFIKAYGNIDTVIIPGAGFSDQKEQFSDCSFSFAIFTQNT